MNIVVWIVQGLLALTFLMTGLLKLTQPKEKLTKIMAFVEDFSPGAVRLIGLVELLGAIGVVLPTLTGILTWLTPLAAVGLAATMVSAASTHWRRKEYQIISINMVLLAMAVFVAYVRFVVVPVPA